MSATASPPQGRRYWFLIVVAVLATAALVFPRLQPDAERNLLAWQTLTVLLAAGFLTLLWFLFLSRVSWRTRGRVLLLLVLVNGGLFLLLRVDGTIDGRGLPQFVWRWNYHQLPDWPNDGAEPSGALVFGAANVPGFFGPERDGIVRDVKLARDWTATPPEELWRQPIGPAWSAFAVVNGRAYTQEQRGEDEAVTCYELVTGAEYWTHTDPAHFSQWQGGEGPRATPTVDRGRVFTYGATGLLTCLDATTGQLVWQRNVLTEYHLENLTWGTSASPLVFEDTVVITGGATAGPTVLAFRREDGQPLWQAGTDKASYASPILATLAGKRVVLSVNAATVTAHDPATGALLLDYPWTDDKWPKAAQPVVLPGDRLFLSAGYGMGALLLKIDATPEGPLRATQLWKSLRMKTQFNSVTPRDGYLYGLDDGLLACVEIATGERKWKDGRFGSGQSLLVGDLLLIQSEPGPVILAGAQPDGFHEYARLPALSSKTWNHPTLAGRYLLVRNDREAVCYRLPVEATK